MKNAGLDQVFGELERDWSDEDRADLARYRKELEAESELVRLADAIRSGRSRKKLSQRALAALAGIQQAELSRIEKAKGNPTALTQSKLFAALGIRTEYKIAS